MTETLLLFLSSSDTDTDIRTGAARRPIRRAVVATVLVLCGVAGMSVCGKSVPSRVSQSPVASTPVATTPSGQSSGNTALQVVDTTAAQAGKTGAGSTVVGTAMQQIPPLWV